MIKPGDRPGSNPLTLPQVDLGPLKVSSATWPEVLVYTESLLRDGGQHYFCFCEASLLSSLIRDPELARMLQTSDAIFPDGIALLRLAKICGQTLAGRIPGPRFLLAACEYGASRGWRHFFYGGGPGVADKLAARLQADYRGLLVAGTLSPPFRASTAEEERETQAVIEAAKPDLVWVCLGSPKQERWCAEHVGKLKVPLLLPVGAAFDFHSGQRPWAPAWVRRLGLEWLFRALTGGRRTFLRNIKCVSIVALYIAKVALSRLAAPRPRPGGNR
jgi:N-acetylglucosaminyldiphosphoundecaprenol N-acetyl-beta-D-mannosaminyltransferase